MDVKRCKKESLFSTNGFSLTEVMIALVVLLVVFLALMQTALLGIDSNTRNLLRDEAVRIAEQRMNEAKNDTDFDGLVSDNTAIGSADCPGGWVSRLGTNGELIERNFRNIAAFDFCTNMDVNQSINLDNKQVTLTVGWQWKGEDFYHVIDSLVRRP
jgi:prepilin-type N-terminal cleavage/methylation domain-containing protein